MTDQHRATPEQWAMIERYGTECQYDDSCILELRDRVEALEKAQPQPWAVPPGFQPLIQRSDLVARITEAVKREPYGTAGVHAVIREVANWLESKAKEFEWHHEPDGMFTAVEALRDEIGEASP